MYTDTIPGIMADVVDSERSLSDRDVITFLNR